MSLDGSLRGRSLVSVADLTREEVDGLFVHARALKDELRSRGRHQLAPLAGRTLAMIFEKPSLRTRVTFETGMTQLGGHAIYLAPADIQLGVRETVADVARNLSRWVDGVIARVFRHAAVAELAEAASVPVVNALSDVEHPCQALADLFTVLERRGGLRGLTLTFVGDGNNVYHSLLLLGSLLGIHVRLASPAGYEGDAAIFARAQAIAAGSGSRLERFRDPHEAVCDADVIYTDVWASMGQEAEAAARARLFAPYRVDEALVRAAGRDVVVMHCLPAHRGQEITSDVLDGAHSIVLDQAENRMHLQKAILVATMA
ncbi:MAG: ornithine carbamoyltransferase [Chloroflexi bacterium GWC2_73_18]|nr:MAG: ornithine carbamoyltransferase [Chloroflexi bacterium GWC2_73_18]